MGEHMQEQQGPHSRAHCRLASSVLASSALLLLGTACVRWQPVSGADICARPLPRWVQVTMRDSVHYMLRDARVVTGDTLVGDPGTSPSLVRLPVADIAHLEARVPSGPGSIGVGALVVVGFFGALALLTSALGGWD